mmetsp:Transcript_66687/g.201290  ORF Transcript_66687/g.201290 Transcript_66687/m.201290 type:complete len:288 (-) Transcript_66687:191-1054(-)
MLLEGAEHLVCPTPVLRIAGVVVHVVDGLRGLGPQEVVGRVPGREDHVRRALVQVEANVLGRQPRRAALVHLVARASHLGSNALPPRVDLTLRQRAAAQHEHASHKAREMVHPVPQPVVVFLVDEGEPTSSLRDELLHRLPHRGLPRVLEAGLVLARLKPLLQEVLVVGVAHPPQGDLATNEAGRVGRARQEDGNEAAAMRCLQHHVHGPVGRRGVPSVARDVGQVAELQLQRRDLRKNHIFHPGVLGRLASADVHLRVGDAVGGLEGGHELVGQPARGVQENLPAA